MLYVWIAAFAYDELSEFWDAGSLFYAVDFWNAWDLCIITVGAASFVTRKCHEFLKVLLHILIWVRSRWSSKT